MYLDEPSGLKAQKSIDVNPLAAGIQDGACSQSGYN